MKIVFEFMHPVHGLFCDALNLPDDHELSNLDIDVLKQERFNNWVSYLEASPIEEQPISEPQ